MIVLIIFIYFLFAALTGGVLAETDLFTLGDQDEETWLWTAAILWPVTVAICVVVGALFGMFLLGTLIASAVKKVF